MHKKGPGTVGFANVTFIYRSLRVVRSSLSTDESAKKNADTHLFGVQGCSRSTILVKKGKERKSIYIAPIYSVSRRSDMDHTVSPQITPYLPS